MVEHHDRASGPPIALDIDKVGSGACSPIGSRVREACFLRSSIWIFWRRLIFCCVVVRSTTIIGLDGKVSIGYNPTGNWGTLANGPGVSVLQALG